LLLAMGLRSFSMQPAQVSAVKQCVLRADARRLAAKLPQVLASDDPERSAAALLY
jgi:phosphotransferase system enzyme I (PtsI)